MSANQSSARRALGLIVTAAALVLGAIVADYASHYFFLFDDFALVGQASTVPFRGIVATPLFGFYRPVVFLLVKVESWAFTWRHPAGYLALSLAIHGASAALTFGVLRRFGLAAVSAAAGAVLFAASPWSSEAVFWLSGSFDVLSGLGILVCLSAALSLSAAGTARKAITLGAVAVAGASVAILAKENALLALPVLVVAAMAGRDGVKGTRGRWLVPAAIVAIEGGYLLFRNRLLPEFGSAYGSIGSLYSQTHAFANVLGYVRAFMTVPLPRVRAGTQPSQAAIVLILAALSFVTALAWFRHRGLAAAALLGLAAAIVPTLWMPPIPFATQGGRFMYLPGLCGCLVFAAAIDALATRGRAARIASTAMAAAVLSLALVSVRHQSSAWSSATSLARTAIEQFRPLAGSGVGRVFIPNLPFWFDGGPYVLKDYAFAYYYPGPATPIVRSRNVALDARGGRLHFAGWLDASGLPETVPLCAADGERVLGVEPVADGTPLAEVNPSRLSVFATLDSQRVSEATVALSAVTPWRAEVSDPSLIAVEPQRGEGSVTLRIVPQPRRTAVDRAVTVFVRSADPQGGLMASFDVRLRLSESFAGSRPFGSVDFPASLEVTAAAPVTLAGWALDVFSLRRVYGEGVAVDGRRTPLGDARRDGERPDVAGLFPNGHDLYRAGWTLSVDDATIGRLARPATVEIYAESSDGVRTRIGTRTLR